MVLTAEHPREVRNRIRRGELVRPTAGLCPGYAQANLVILPRELAFDFILFCQRNPKPCPILEVLEPGKHEPTLMAPGADIRVDVSLYRIYKEGKFVSEVRDLKDFWRNDLVTFLLGCSFTFEAALVRAGISLRHIDEGKNVSMYKTGVKTVPAGMFSGPLVVTMRPIPRQKVVKAVQITSRFPSVHGAPVHIGDPQKIGIKDLSKPDYGDPVEVKSDEVPVFWACGVTPQAVAMESKPPLMITHSPGHMFITDVLDEDLSVL
ncbi:MAG: putative hydro-lyase [Chloroflexi bacterium]|nr:putative hydro-lyase [Chloroflexota bacterium]